MLPITFTASFGNIKKIVEITRPLGNLDFYQVRVDGEFYGDLICRNGVWEQTSPRTIFQADDYMVLMEIIESAKK